MENISLFNKIWVIESLRTGDIKTGYNLVHDHLSYLSSAKNKVEVEYREARTKFEFIQILEEIERDTRENKNFPIIHIECHGSPAGLSCANNEFIEWEELRAILININKASRLNLIVVMAACNGAHLIKVATKLDIAPFWAVIGPDQEVTFDSVEVNFKAFYTEYFDGLSGGKAVYALNQGSTVTNRKYHFFSSLGLFVKAFRAYYNGSCVGKGRKKREEELLTEALQNPAINAKGVPWARKTLKEQIRNVECQYNRYLNKFFMMDLFSENKERFNLPYKEFLKEYINP